jgi:mycothiol system anti-sigma-R factor
MTTTRPGDGAEPMPARPIADCDDAVRQLYAFLDNELTDELRTAFRRHLDGCGPCVEVVEFEAELRRVIASKCHDRVPDDLRLRIVAAISTEAERRASGGSGCV